MGGKFRRISPRALRLGLVLIVIIAAAPGTWVRSPPVKDTGDFLQSVTVTEIPTEPVRTGEFEVAGAWELNSTNWHFGSFSAMVPLGGGRLLAVSDHGRRMEFTLPDSGSPDPHFDYIAGPIRLPKRFFDAESATRDPDTGRVWVGYEGTNSIIRLGSNLQPEKRASPAAMEDWPGNGGAESMVRLRDGRFIVVAEEALGWFQDDSEALLFPGDPVEGTVPLRFRFRPSSGFLPVDMAQLPDGKVLILLRRLKWRVPQRFANQLVLADPAEIREGMVWRGKVVAEIDDPIPSDNYEGLAIIPSVGGGYAAWLISDDNGATFQRTLLLKLVWQPPATDTGKGARN